ncbi:hypothetical protein V1478_004169 [Vespula squamosa]|uniref:Reverse transcriptase zinc-binding domain-containing protein n=1 Tax=Vespula squamosa TaxID=30214 RepID=A0ABD2BK29_VESSQ
MKARLHWMKQEDKRHRICGEKEKKIEHVLYECAETRSTRDDFKRILGNVLDFHRHVSNNIPV